MFSGLLSSFQFQSPKALLASHLAGALATYFVVDPAQIESSLVMDTTIVLRRIELRPQSISIGSGSSSSGSGSGGACALLLVGGVEEIHFAWKWGGSADGSTSFAREAVLTIRGAKFRIVVPNGKSAAAPAGAAAVAAEDRPKALTSDTENGEPVEKKQQAPEGYIERHVRQIIDHLTLSITDVELVVEIPAAGQEESSGYWLVVEAKSLKLVSFGRQQNTTSDHDTSSSSTCDDEPAPPLSQRLSLDMLSAYILKGGDGDDNDRRRYRLLDPFGYAASVRRVSGQRFLNFAQGLEVTGDVLTSQWDLVVHAGTEQLSVLKQIASDLIDDVSVRPTTSQGRVPHQPPQQEEAKPQDSNVQSTAFTLPFPSLVLILPNDSKVKMPNCIFKYCMDGTSFRLSGNEGIKINEHPSPFIQLSDGATWCIDFNKSHLSLMHLSSLLGEDGFCDAHEEELEDSEPICSTSHQRVANLHWDENEMKCLFEGLRALEKGTRSVVEQGLEVYHKGDFAPLEVTASPWSVAVHGQIHVAVYGTNGETVEAFLEPSSLTLPASVGSGGLLGEFSTAGITVGPTTFGDTKIHFPAMTLNPENNTLISEAAIEIFIESLPVASNIQKFMIRLLDTDPPATSCTSHATASETFQPKFGVEAPFIVFSIAEPDPTTFFLKDNTINKEGDGRLGSLTWGDGDKEGFSGLMSDITFTAAREQFQVQVQSFNDLCIPGMFRLCQPLHGLELKLEEGALQVDLPSSVSLVTLNHDNMSSVEGTASVTDISVPVPIHLSVSELYWKAGSEGNDPTVSSIHALILLLKPAISDQFSLNQSAGTDFILTCHKLENKLITLNKTSASGTVNGSLDTITNFVLQPTAASVSAGFSSFEWTSMFSGNGEEKKQKVIRLPFARIASFPAHVEYTGNIVSAKTGLKVEKLAGGPTTSSNDIVQFFTNSFLREIPSFFSNAEVLGGNVADMTAQSVARTVLAQGLTGSVAGSVAGLVVTDSVKGAISSGKKARGVENESKYRFGDFTRGAIRAIKETAKSGGEGRRGNKDSYQFGDFSAGATQSIKQYSQTNKSRLGGGAGSGVGMVIGTALAGPVGFLAGSYIGGRAGSKAFEESGNEAAAAAAAGGSDAPASADSEAAALATGSRAAEDEAEMEETIRASLEDFMGNTGGREAVGAEDDDDGGDWACGACTYTNHSGSHCDMCGTAR